MVSEKEMTKLEISTTYELRLIFDDEMDKRQVESLTRKEIHKLFDNYARECNKTT